MNVRPAAVAGKFYPAAPDQLESDLALFLEAARPDTAAAPPKALIAPHAGYLYSGPTAGAAFSTLAAQRGLITRVVHLGPSHFVAVEGLAASTASAFETPLGQIPVDRASVAAVLKLPQVVALDEAHRNEHALEVHLPFLQRTLGDSFELVPLVVGKATPSEIEEVLDLLWGGDETLIVVSSDLSHFHDYATACEMDRRTSDAIEQLAPEQIGADQACGRLPIQGLLLAAKRRGLTARLLDLRNSGDTAGTRDRVVGYGAYAFAFA
jgi:AmmeMemoRadiSam system protein B